ncbi:unnamed protein product [Neospora caninum Liverpool]|uniref:Uracil-DNA glycosylase n=1 Tax=Neospora caninum (strain Liverpool) TaxID=572307 RepID=F0V7D1_NEOCL|nr:uncharacterized protein NCLIV_001137 [Neospora caninum Liverpool]CBZ49622.1 unnamed protein product [Neospora caninum Liverpool]|eukprot:XP_003879657.1 uncharacterized protein NCLIV_001137 [Neospora caninum Liverpool]
MAPTKKRAGEFLSLADKKRPAIASSARPPSTARKGPVRTVTLSSFFSAKTNTSGKEQVYGTKPMTGASACQLATTASSGDLQREQLSAETRQEEQIGEGEKSVDSASLVKVPTGTLLVDPDGEMREPSEAAALWRQTLGDCWFDALKEELRLPYFRDCMQFIRRERQKYRVYPPPHLVFNAFKQTPLNAVKVVVVGQDPYHQPRQAMLMDPHTNRISSFVHGDLTAWASQGVFLLNSLLTVRESTPMSHRTAASQLRKSQQASVVLVTASWNRDIRRPFLCDSSRVQRAVEIYGKGRGLFRTLALTPVFDIRYRDSISPLTAPWGSFIPTGLSGEQLFLVEICQSPWISGAAVQGHLHFSTYSESLCIRYSFIEHGDNSCSGTWAAGIR